MGKNKEDKKQDKARRKEEKARRKAEKAKRREEKARRAEQKAAARVTEQESLLEKRERSLLRRARRGAAKPKAAPHPDPSPPGSGEGAVRERPRGREARAEAEARGPKTEAARRRPKTEAEPEGRGPRTEPEGRGPRTEPEGRGPRTESEGRGPRTESEDRGPNTEAEARGPKTEAEGRGPDAEPEAARRGPRAEAEGEPEAAPAPERPRPRKAAAKARRGGKKRVRVAQPEANGNSLEPDLEDERNAHEEVEAQLDRLLRRSMTPEAAGRAREVLGDGERLAGRLTQDGPETRGSSVLDSARELLSSDYYLRVWGQLGMRGRSIEIDEYGLDPKVEQKWQPFFDFLYRAYWRVQVRGIENVPEEGRCLLVANHSGTIPYDGAMIKTAVLREHPARRSVRWLAEDFVFHFPFLGAFMNRIGAVRACQENADRLLRQERLVAVFPEGIKGIGKLYKERYQLQRFGRGGYVKLVLRTGAPIVPVAVVGAEEIHPLLLRGRRLANMVGMPYLPVTPTFPLLGPLGLVPLPSQWLIAFGEPISFDRYGPEAADDPVLVNRLNDEVRGRIQQMLDGLLAIRKGAA